MICWTSDREHCLNSDSTKTLFRTPAAWCKWNPNGPKCVSYISVPRVRAITHFMSFLQGHFTRGMALSSLGKYQEALLEFSLSAVLGENQQKLKSKISEVLQRLLILYSKETEALDLERWDPISHGYLRSYLNTFINGSNMFENSNNSSIAVRV